MKKGILLVNLGTPQSLSVKDVRIYLREFLMDPYVINLPYLIRFILVNGIIVPFRAPKSTAAYAKIWTEHGSPLLYHTKNLQKEIQKKLPEDFIVEIGMRYGNPNIKQAIFNLKNKGAKEIYAIALYPQYAQSSTQTAVDVIKKITKENNIEVYIEPPFYNKEEYIIAQKKLIENRVKEFNPEHLLLSFHGLPEAHILKLNPDCRICLATTCTKIDSPVCYRAQCYQTARMLMKDWHNLPYTVAFQSRLGKTPWIKPYSDATIINLAKSGVKRLLVSCPAFTADCLETLEEMAIANKELFLEHGGEDYQLVEALNSSPLWADAIVNWSKNFFI